MPKESELVMPQIKRVTCDFEARSPSSLKIRRAYPVRLPLHGKMRESLVKRPPPMKPTTLKTQLPLLVVARESEFASMERSSPEPQQMELQWLCSFDLRHQCRCKCPSQPLLWQDDEWEEVSLRRASHAMGEALAPCAGSTGYKAVKERIKHAERSSGRGTSGLSGAKEPKFQVLTRGSRERNGGAARTECAAGEMHWKPTEPADRRRC